jgi:hypothetical protein
LTNFYRRTFLNTYGTATLQSKWFWTCHSIQFLIF